MKARTPAKRLHALAAQLDLTIDEFSPGLRVWTIRRAGSLNSEEPLAFGVPHSQVADRLRELAN